jgi:hypothetical protein
VSAFWLWNYLFVGECLLFELLVIYLWMVNVCFVDVASPRASDNAETNDKDAMGNHARRASAALLYVVSNVVSDGSAASRVPAT